MRGAACPVRNARTKVAKDGAVKLTRRGSDKGDARGAALLVERDQRCVAPACCDNDAEALKHVGREWTWRQGAPSDGSRHRSSAGPAAHRKAPLSRS